MSKGDKVNSWVPTILVVGVGIRCVVRGLGMWSEEEDIYLVVLKKCTLQEML